MLKKWFDKIYSSENPIRIRLFRIVLTIGIITISIALIGNLMLQHSVYVTISLLAGLVILLLALWISCKYNKMETSAILLEILINMVMLPVIFFISGGIEGGATVWLVLGITFIFLLFTGRKLIIFLSIMITEVLLLYYIGYTYPEWITPLANRGEVFSDSLLAVVLASVVIGVLIKFQAKEYEKERALSEQQKKEIERISQSKSDFFANMSHEIRTPINTIIGLNEMTLREDISDEIAENAINIQNASKMLLALINDILDVSKIESGKMEIVPVQYETGAMFSDLVNIVWIRAHEKNLEFKIDVAEDIPSMLFGDEVRIKQVLVNLLMNAVKYTKAGSVTLAARCEKIDANRIRLRISVTDTGMGIRKENMENLFSTFKRLDEEKNREIEGTGLGLSISKQLVNMMQGSIEVDSIYTKGSTFTVTIEQEIINVKPMGSFDFMVKHKIYNRDKYKRSFEAPDARVLIVDDNEMNLMVASKLLRSTKVQVDTAKSGAECLKMTKDKLYHVIFMDHKMPDMDGVETLQNIQKQVKGLCQNVPVIALTANVMTGAEQMYQEYGFQGYLAKPIHGALFEATLLKVLPEELIEVSMDIDDADVYDSKGTIQMVMEKQKKPICITTDCVCDLPQEWLERFGIKMMYCYVVTDKGKFRDIKEISADNLLNYLAEASNHAYSEPASVEEYEKFFADALAEAERVIHISVSKYSSSGYEVALSAARGFGHVTVVDSGQLSSGTGVMVLQAAKMVQEHYNKKEIIDKLESLKDDISTSFIVPNAGSLYRNGKIGRFTMKLCQAMDFHLVLRLKQGKIKFQRVESGQVERAYQKYIRRQLRYHRHIDNRILFITFVGCSLKQQKLFVDEVNKHMKFDKIVLQKASATISSNCGLGAVGLIYMKK